DRNGNIGIQKSVAGKGEGKPVSLAATNKGTTFLRPEDGAWDPRNPNRYYFVTTDRNNFAADGTARDRQPVDQVGRARLSAVTFDPAKFGDVVNAAYTPPTAPFTDDKETSGVLDVSDVFADAAWARPGAQVLLTVVQAHFEYDAKDPSGAALVEGGQLLLLTKS